MWTFECNVPSSLETDEVFRNPPNEGPFALQILTKHNGTFTSPFSGFQSDSIANGYKSCQQQIAFQICPDACNNPEKILIEFLSIGIQASLTASWCSHWMRHALR